MTAPNPTPPNANAPERAIPIRRPDLDFAAEIPHHWAGGNAFATHVFNGMNLLFPDGERFFIQSVRDQMTGIDDPVLKKQVRQFNGQEGRHAHEHERYFDVLEAQGYEVRRFLKWFRRYLRVMSRILPAPLRLAITAGTEHYTAVFGSLVVGGGTYMDEAHPTMRKLVVWHATEEIEHKAVAFDVLQRSAPSHWLRMVGYAIATVTLFGWAAIATRMLIRQDVAAGRLDGPTIAKHRAAMQEKEAQLAPIVRHKIKDYRRRDFHPDDTDELPEAYALMEELGLPLGQTT